MKGRPSLTFDNDGSPRVSIPIDELGNSVSVVCTPEGLSEFLSEVRLAMLERSSDPKFREHVGGQLLDLARKLLQR